MAKKTTLYLVLIQILINSTTSMIVFPIGGLFNGFHREITRQTFEYMSTSNTMRQFKGRTIYPDSTDIYSVSLEMCKNTEDDKGITSLIDFRPTNGLCDNTCLLCNRLNITHLTIGWEPTETLAEDLYTFAYHPSPKITSTAFATLIKHFNWDRFSYLYEDDDSFIRGQEIINTWPQDKDPITYRKLDPDGDNRETFKYIFKTEKLSYHVLDCDKDNVVKYLNQMIEVENATQYQSFILMSLDAHLLNLSVVPNFMANVSTLHLIEGNCDEMLKANVKIRTEEKVTTETALAVDALTHLEKAIRYYQSEQDKRESSRDTVDLPPNPPALCYKSFRSDYEREAWPVGMELRNALIDTRFRGYSGNIQFDEIGQRKNVRLHYSKLSAGGVFMYVGYWESTKSDIQIEAKVEDYSATWKNGIIRVISISNLPYFQLKEINGTVEPRGYAVDLANSIFEILNSNGTEFTLQFSPVLGYGNPIEGTRKWSGLIGELMEHNAELGICDLGITSDRNKVVDFSLPFMTTGISMLYRKAEPDPPNMYSFLSPLGLDVWLYLATTYILVSFIMLICSRMTQGDWVNPHPCNQNPDSLQNIWSLYNCMWLTMGTIMTQGCDILPSILGTFASCGTVMGYLYRPIQKIDRIEGFGSRWITGTWFFFAMIVTASYTANMSTFLSNNRRDSEITDVKELASQTSVIPGAVKDASTYKFFKYSTDPIFQKIWTIMSSAKPEPFTSSNVEGKDRVISGRRKYIFFMESTAIEYFTNRDCNLTMVGRELDSKEYGIAMPRNFPHIGLINKALLSLQESGKLSALRDKWWKHEDIESPCPEEEKAEDADALQMENTSGIFLVLGLGAILGLIVAIVEFMLHAYTISMKEKVTFKEAVISEWNASLNPRALAKPTAPPRSAAPSESPPPERLRSQSRAISVLRAASSFINFDQIY